MYLCLAHSLIQRKSQLNMSAPWLENLHGRKCRWLLRQYKYHISLKGWKHSDFVTVCIIYSKDYVLFPKCFMVPLLAIGYQFTIVPVSKTILRDMGKRSYESTKNRSLDETKAYENRVYVTCDIVYILCVYHTLLLAFTPTNWLKSSTRDNLLHTESWQNTAEWLMCV